MTKQTTPSAPATPSVDPYASAQPAVPDAAGSVSSPQPYAEALSKFSPTNAALREMATEAALILEVKDAPLEQVRASRMTLVRTRTALDKTRETLKADALAYGRAVDGEYKRLVAIIAPTEAALEKRQGAIEAAKELIRKDAEAAKLRRAEGWIRRFHAVGHEASLIDCRDLEDATLEARLAMATALLREAQQRAAAETARKAAEEFAAAAQREAEDAARRKAEADERARLEAEHRAAQEALAAERAKAAEERAERLAERAAENRARAEEAEKLRRELEVARAAQHKAEAAEAAAKIAAAEQITTIDERPAAPSVATMSAACRGAEQAPTREELWDVIAEAVDLIDDSNHDSDRVAEACEILNSMLSRRERAEVNRA